MPWNFAAAGEIGESEPAHSGKLARLAEWQDFLGIQRKSKFRTQARLYLGRREPKTRCDGFRDIEVKRH
jgi:hypothetical protein